ncbi:Uncharacterised protein [BD1-7 clade bacterium]|uniref:HTH cro/C1-type domain-containing protein n=1 Tax=BD1-7 clade bacterium TaxID=2029982 RepID=A0A5S9QU49_9GAMM|nr:Uncharacterised protein [BD1-7 clade bacterium]CAA0122928.1 Uncharacterised protein [BD1-7 clade bacterium]
MISSDTSADDISRQLGERLKHARLNADLTQLDVAKRAGISRKAVLNAEKGQAQLSVFVAILLALDSVAQLNQFLPEPPISPVQLSKLRGKQRQRASGKRGSDHPQPDENAPDNSDAW